MPEFYTLVTLARREGLLMAHTAMAMDEEPDLFDARALLELTLHAMTVAEAGIPCAGPHANAEAEAFALTYLWLTAQANKLRLYVLAVQ